MKRSDRNNPCPICKRSSDGCLYAEDGTAAICVRVVEGSVKVAGQAGYLHIIKPGDFKPKPVVKRRPATINWNTLNDCYIDSFLHNRIHYPPFNASLNTLQAMGTGWDGEAYTFPVRNANDEIIGISRRWPDGTKGMVKDSQVGIFIPRLNWDNLETLFICEGASDTATALDMGLKAIGRVSCQTGVHVIVDFCKTHQPKLVVIIADSDKPGIAGANHLRFVLGYEGITTLVYVPGNNTKDLREYMQNGGTTAQFLESVQNLLDF